MKDHKHVEYFKTRLTALLETEHGQLRAAKAHIRFHAGLLKTLANCKRPKFHGICTLAALRCLNNNVGQLFLLEGKDPRTVSISRWTEDGWKPVFAPFYVSPVGRIALLEPA
jgi:hypothetical protein